MSLVSLLNLSSLSSRTTSTCSLYAGSQGQSVLHVHVCFLMWLLSTLRQSLFWFRVISLFCVYCIGRRSLGWCGRLVFEWVCRTCNLTFLGLSWANKDTDWYQANRDCDRNMWFVFVSKLVKLSLLDDTNKISCTPMVERLCVSGYIMTN